MRSLMLAILAIITLAGSKASGSEQDLRKTVQPFHAEGLGVIAFLQEAARLSSIPIGLETDLTFGTEVKVEKDFPGGTIEDLGRMCASTLDRGAWTVFSDHSLLISTPGSAAQVGDLTVNYPGKRSASRHEIWESLSRLTELNEWLKTNQCHRAELFNGYEWRGDNLPQDLPKGYIKLRDLLEVSTTSSSKFFWSIVRNTRDGDCEINISLR